MFLNVLSNTFPSMWLTSSQRELHRQMFRRGHVPRRVSGPTFGQRLGHQSHDEVGRLLLRTLRMSNQCDPCTVIAPCLCQWKTKLPITHARGDLLTSRSEAERQRLTHESRGRVHPLHFSRLISLRFAFPCFFGFPFGQGKSSTKSFLHNQPAQTLRFEVGEVRPRSTPLGDKG